MTLGIPAFSTSLGAILDQVHAGTLAGAPLVTALQALWEQYDSVLTLADKVEALLAIKAAMVEAVRLVGIKGFVGSVAELPEVAEDGDGYKIDHFDDELDGHLFVRVDGIWTDFGVFGGAGWSPVTAAVNDGARVVFKITNWTGGQGTKPAINVYLGPAGLVNTAAEAVDIVGVVGSALSTYVNAAAASAEASEESHQDALTAATDAIDTVEDVHAQVITFATAMIHTQAMLADFIAFH